MAILAPRITPRPIGTVFQSPSATAEQAGAGIGRAQTQFAGALGQVSDEAARIAINMQIEDNEKRAKELDNAYVIQRNELLYGEQGFYSTRANDTITAAPAIKEQLSDIRKQLLETSGNDRIEAMFGEVSFRRLQSDSEQIDKYTLGQREQALDDATQARVDLAVNEVALSWNDPSVLNRSLGLVRGELISLADRKGWSVEVLQMELAKIQSDIYSEAISGALSSGDLGSAQQLYITNQDKILGTEQSKIANRLLSIQRQRIIDIERAEAAAEKALKQAQTERWGTLLSRAAQFDLSEIQLREELDAGNITPQMYQNTLSFVRSEIDEGQDRHDPQAELEWRHYLYSGEGISPEFNPGSGDLMNTDISQAIMEDERLGPGQKSELLALQDQIRRRSPLLGRADVQHYLQQIDDVIGNRNALGGFPDPQLADRAANAKQEFLERVEAGEKPAVVFNEINSYDGYRQFKPSLQTLPRSKYWPGLGVPGSRLGTQEELMQKWKRAYLELSNDAKNLAIDEALRQFELLDRYKEVIEGME